MNPEEWAPFCTTTDQSRPLVFSKSPPKWSRTLLLPQSSVHSFFSDSRLLIIESLQKTHWRTDDLNSVFFWVLKQTLKFIQSKEHSSIHTLVNYIRSSVSRLSTNVTSLMKSLAWQIETMSTRQFSLAHEYTVSWVGRHLGVVSLENSEN